MQSCLPSAGLHGESCTSATRCWDQPNICPSLCRCRGPLTQKVTHFHPHHREAFEQLPGDDVWTMMGTKIVSWGLLNYPPTRTPPHPSRARQWSFSRKNTLSTSPNLTPDQRAARAPRHHTARPHGNGEPDFPSFTEVSQPLLHFWLSSFISIFYSHAWIIFHLIFGIFIFLWILSTIIIITLLSIILNYGLFQTTSLQIQACGNVLLF